MIVLRIINVLAGGIYLIAGLAVIAIGIGSLLYVLLELVLGTLYPYNVLVGTIFVLHNNNTIDLYEA